MRTVGEVLVVVGAVVAGRSLLTVVLNMLFRPLSRQANPLGPPKDFLRMSAIGFAALGIGLLLVGVT